MRIILGSHSPRRQQILKELHLDFTVIPSHVNEEAIRSADPKQLTQLLATEKSVALQNTDIGDCILITADTVVFANGVIMEKGTSPDECAAMMRSLSGKTAKVITSVVVVNTQNKKCENFTDVATIHFNTLPDDLIHALAPHFFERGCAGGFDVSEPLLKPFFTIEGDETTVRGLPQTRTRQAIDSVM
jgi:septum formation protein